MLEIGLKITVIGTITASGQLVIRTHSGSLIKPTIRLTSIFLPDASDGNEPLFEQDKQVRQAALGTVAGFFAFGLDRVFSRSAPGTMGTLVAIPFTPLSETLRRLVPGRGSGLVSYRCLFVGVTASRIGQHDPGSYRLRLG